MVRFDIKSLIAGVGLMLMLGQAGVAQDGLTQAGLAQDGLGFSISVDGLVIAGDDIGYRDAAYGGDNLEKIDIQVKFDGLDVRPQLSIVTGDGRSEYGAGETIVFEAESNYPRWITGAEIQVFAGSTGRVGRPLVILPVGRSHAGLGSAAWQMPDAGTSDYRYVLRVYDGQGRFDETVTRALSRVDDAEFASFSELEGEGENGAKAIGLDHTAVRNIPVFGGAVTIYGSHVPPGYQVRALGERIAVDRQGRFVVQRILPPGVHGVDVRVGEGQGQGMSFSREINIPSDDWFYIGLADLTFGQRFGSDNVVAANPGVYDQIYSKGRLAFYLKGKIKGEYLLTAAADTGEGSLDDVFTGLDAKDPRRVLQRIDPQDYYPVYGDDSTRVEDAPTDGKFYVRLARGDSHVMWGRYKTNVTGSNFVRSQRAYYGGRVVYHSDRATENGDKVFDLEAYAGQQGTHSQRDVMRGTGGSAYFLSHQDIVRGSETVTIETRDLASGQVKARQSLQSGQDYRLDLVQGVIILDSPLGASASGGDVVSDAALGDYGLNLVVQYDYTPSLGDIEGYDFGGRAQVWLGDSLRLGASNVAVKNGTGKNAILGADVHLRLGPGSFIEGEIAQSTGTGSGGSYSVNGGLVINQTGTSGINGQSALGYSFKGQVDLADVNPELRGSFGGYAEKREAGFTALDFDTATTQTVWGANGAGKIRDGVDFRITYDDFSNVAGTVRQEANGSVDFELNDQWRVAVGVKHGTFAGAAASSKNGARTDLGGRVTYQPGEKTKAYLFGQASVAQSGNLGRNDRLGVGGEVRVAEHIGLRGEISGGTSGFGGFAGASYDPKAGDHYYVGYQIDPDRAALGNSAIAGQDMGTIVVGMKRRHDETFSTYAENNYDMFGKRRSLTTTYGMIYTPDQLWTVNGGVEYGRVEDLAGVELSRTALSGTVGYREDDLLSWRARGEARFETSAIAGGDRVTYLASAQGEVKSSPDWRMIGGFDAVISRSDQSAILDGDYISGSIGGAYRPADNDGFNGLLKYRFLYDLPGADQVSAVGSKLGPAQRSHVFSVDASYDLSPIITIGAKYGLRLGEISSSRSADDFVASSAHLAIVRADLHLVKYWDVLVEGRMLMTPESESYDLGMLLAVYRHLGDNFKIGLGYNFSSFSEDLTDLTYDDGGLFINLVGKF